MPGHQPPVSRPEICPIETLVHSHRNAVYRFALSILNDPAEPDIAFVRKDHIPPVDQQQGFWQMAPDLVVEIISPSESADAIQEKVADYLAAGTQLIWLVYPKLKLVTEYRPGAIRQYDLDDSLEGGAVLQGFTLPLKQLFRE